MRRRQLLGAIPGLTGIPMRSGQRAGYGPLGMVEIEGATEAVVSDDGRTAYVAAQSGFATVDVSNPASPTVLAERRNLLSGREAGPMEAVIDLKIDGDRLVVPGPGHPTGADTVTGFLLFDVADPATPEQLAFHETGAPIHNAYLENDLVYLTQGSTVDLIEITDDEPTQVGEIDIEDFDGRWSDVDGHLRRPHDVWVRDRIAYVPWWDAGTWVIDTSDPTSPTVVTHIETRPFEEIAAIPADETVRESIEPPGNHHYAQSSDAGQLLAIGKESWDAVGGDGSGGPSGIELWDVSDPTDPRLHAEIRPPRATNETRQGTWTTSHNFDLVGERLYTAWYQGGVKIYDVSEPGRPKELVWWRDPNRFAFWTAKLATEEFYVASAAAGRIGPDLEEGLVTFPAAIPEQAESPSSPAPASPPTVFRTARPTATDTPVPTSTAPEPPTTTATPTDTGTPTPSRTPSPARPQRPASWATESTGQPGFDLIGGLAGIAAGFWWLLRGRSGRD